MAQDTEARPEPLARKIGRHDRRRSERTIPPVQAALQSAIQAEFGERVTLLPAGGWEYNLTFGVPRDNSEPVFSTLKSSPKFDFNMLSSVTAVDWLDKREPRFDVVYQLVSLKLLHRLVIKIQAPEEDPAVDSVTHLWASANFMEREVWDMYGVRFRGHPDLRRILLYDEFVGHPLRKDYPLRGKQPRVPLRIPELRNTAADMFRDELVRLPSRKGGEAKGEKDQHASE